MSKVENILFDKKYNLKSLGRNGWSIQKGIELYNIDKASQNVEIQPLNSRLVTTRCMISIPKQHIPELILKLQSFL